MPQAIVVQKQKDFFKKGEIVFKEGDTGQEMYIMKSGKVEVVKKTGDEEVILASLVPSAFFGEMALFGDPHRSATIRAAEDTQMIVITKPMLESQFERVPDWFVTILKTLVERLRATNERIKSRFPVNFEFSIMQLLALHASKNGNSAEGGILLPLTETRTDIAVTLGITEEEVSEKLKNLMFVGLIKYSEPKKTILIPEMQRFQNFTTFLRTKATNAASYFGGDDLPTDPTLLEYFEKIYKLLFRRKMVG